MEDSEAKDASDEMQADPEFWELRLYVAGQTPKSVAAFGNLKRLCEERLAGQYRIEVIDLLEHPQLAKGDQILAIPTLVRKLPRTYEEDNRGPFQYGASACGTGSGSARLTHC